MTGNSGEVLDNVVPAAALEGLDGTVLYKEIERANPLSVDLGPDHEVAADRMLGLLRDLGPRAIDVDILVGEQGPNMLARFATKPVLH